MQYPDQVLLDIPHEVGLMYYYQIYLFKDVVLGGILV